jgi:5'-3' exoribonuclease 1
MTDLLVLFLAPSRQTATKFFLRFCTEDLPPSPPSSPSYPPSLSHPSPHLLPSSFIMGVPKFYRWLSERMPLINVSLTSGSEITPPIDNLYLDMNGIVHRCTHPSDDKRDMKAAQYDEMVQNIFQYLDIIFNLIKPQRLLFMAIDGVAPRAKMNQQRSRRFRSAMDDKKASEDAKRKGEEVDENRFDSNCITPGTSFMQRLSIDLEYFVAKKIKEDQAWRKIEVIYSGTLFS